MKHFKTLTSIAAGALLGLAALDAGAQSSGTYSTILDGSTNVSILGLTTNTFSSGYLAGNHSQAISEYDYVGFTTTLNANAANTSTATFQFIQSYDNAATWETTPSITYTTPPLNGTTPVTYGTNFFCPVGTHIKLYAVWNTNATAYFTNITAKFDLKMPKRGANTSVN